ncbi:MAG: BA14K family protein [Cohaesibacteraceae bacterium]
MTFAPKKAIAAAALSLVAIAGTTAATTQTAQANEAVAGVIGFVAGTIVGSAATQAHQPRVVYAQPQTVVVHGGLQPWTPAWYSSCSQRYRSFNAQTGYYLSFSGNYVFCR